MRLRIVLAAIVAVLVTTVVVLNLSEHSTIGSDSRGYVTRDIYAHYGEQSVKIAIVTGIHPREEVSIAPVQWAGRVFALLPVEVIIYSINVEDSPQDYSRGRANGEGLAATYILPDIKRSDYDLVVIAHAHKPGYGEGFYVATPRWTGHPWRSLKGLRGMDSTITRSRAGLNTEAHQGGSSQGPWQLQGTKRSSMRSLSGHHPLRCFS
ncbi:hypothetical protein ACRERI_03915 [Methanothermobacter thermautotrophicus]|uniref:hypothetical protein n=1 Tax=Methanothermobacter thermautotrophicus TaxID=145262 RepID=UPI003D7F8295